MIISRDSLLPLLLLLPLGLTPSCVVPESVGYVESLSEPSTVDPGGGTRRPTSDDCVTDIDCPMGQECCRDACVGAGRCPESATCAAQGQVCEISSGGGYEQQGEFVCARLNGGAGTCLRECEEAFTPSNCDEGTFCFDIDGGGEVLSLCVPSECSSSSECSLQGPSGGTCLGFGNEAGFCFAAGTAQRGDRCETGGSTLSRICATDLYCLADSEGTPRCRTLCDMWSPTSNRCPAGEVCGYLTRGQGACQVQTAQGRLPFEECAPQGDWCADGVSCLDFGTGGESLVVCAAYCRPELPSDCTGRRFGDRVATCQTVFTSGAGEEITTVGLCL